MDIEQAKKAAPLANALNQIEAQQQVLDAALANTKNKGLEDLKQVATQVYNNIPGGFDSLLADIRQYAGEIIGAAITEQKNAILAQIAAL